MDDAQGRDLQAQVDLSRPDYTASCSRRSMLPSAKPGDVQHRGVDAAKTVKWQEKS